jgi:adenine-specific DNA-methyltransferase
VKDAIGEKEQQRADLQKQLDAAKTQIERNRLGQFATPAALAEDIIRFGAGLLEDQESLRFLDPAIGTGVFYSALRRVLPAERVSEALGFEIDPHYAWPAARLWGQTRIKYQLGDFTKASAAPRFNFIVCNPPYVRHHHLRFTEKLRLQRRTEIASGMKLSGLGGLYCHFVGLAHAWMAPDAIAGWLVPSEFMDVNYGRELTRYLLREVTLLHIHRFDPHDVQFADALVSSAVVWFRKRSPPSDHVVTFSYGGTLAQPKKSRLVSAQALAMEGKWTRFPVARVRQKCVLPTVADFFTIKRGLATGDNKYFILTPAEIEHHALPLEAFRPILPSPRYVPGDKVESDDGGRPELERQLFLLDTDLTEEEIERCFPTLHAYLQEGRNRKLHERYLCRHRTRWYAQESRPAAPIVCTYLGREDKRGQRPFRFILNRSKATAANVYLMMYPTEPLAQAIERDPPVLDRVCAVLNDLTPQVLVAEGRVYGGGLHKLEPRELGNVPVPQLLELLVQCSPTSGPADLLKGAAA